LTLHSPCPIIRISTGNKSILFKTLKENYPMVKNLKELAAKTLVAIQKAGNALLNGEKRWKNVMLKVGSDIVLHGYQIIDTKALDLIEAWRVLDSVSGDKRDKTGVQEARQAIYVHFCPNYALVGKGQNADSVLFRKDIDNLIRIVVNKVSALECQPIFNSTDKKPPVASMRNIVKQLDLKPVSNRKPRTADTKTDADADVKFEKASAELEQKIASKIAQYKQDVELVGYLQDYKAILKTYFS